METSCCGVVVGKRWRATRAAWFVAFTLTACDWRDRDPKFLLETKPVADVRHMGFRQDIPDERRGNATFTRARFTKDGDYLVTDGSGFRVWDAITGELRRTIRAWLDPNDALVVDGLHHLLLARSPQTDTLGNALQLWDLRDGSVRGRIPDTDSAPAKPVGITGQGDAVVLRGGVVEVWTPGALVPRLAIAPPAQRVFCGWGRPNSITYNDKECFELSTSGRWLAVTTRQRDDHTSRPIPTLIDLDLGTVREITLPADEGQGGAHGFAFSSDERMLAIGLTNGVWLWRRDRGADSSARDRGVFIHGEHQRNEFLTPMAFTNKDTRLVTLGDQLQVSTFNVGDGALVGRVAPPFEDWEGALRVSADGQRAVAYRFVSDVLVVVDGSASQLRGYLCPFFCNRKHNPVEVPFAVSPDGRRVATGGRLGAGLWDTDADTLIAPLADSTRAPLKKQ